MERAIYKIGQEVEITEDFEFETLGGRKFKVKKGDKAILSSRGTIEYITGNAKGLFQKADCGLKGYDSLNIAHRIFKALCREYNLLEFIECEEINSDEVIDLIEYELNKIL